MTPERLLNAAAASALTLALISCQTAPGSSHLVKVTPLPVDAPVPAPGAAEDELYGRAKAAIDQRDYGLALDVLQIAREARPNDPRVLTAMGVVYDKLGRFDLSRRYYDLAAAADPGSQIVAADRAYSQVLQGLGAGVPSQLAQQAPRVRPSLGAAPAAAGLRPGPVATGQTNSALSVTPAADVSGVSALQPAPAPVSARADDAASAVPVAVPSALEAGPRVTLDELARMPILHAGGAATHAQGEAVAAAPAVEAPAPSEVSLDQLAQPHLAALRAVPEPAYVSASAASNAAAVATPAAALRDAPEVSLDDLPRVANTTVQAAPVSAYPRGEAVATATTLTGTAFQAGPEVAHRDLPRAPTAVLRQIAAPAYARAEPSAPDAVQALRVGSSVQAPPPLYVADDARAATAATVPAAVRAAPAPAYVHTYTDLARVAQQPASAPAVRLEAQAAPALRIASAAPGAGLHVEEPVSYLLHIENAAGEVYAANTVRDHLLDKGWRMAQATPHHGRMLAASFLRFPPSHRRIAHALARTLTFPVRLESCAGCSRMTLVVGADAAPWAKGRPVRRV